ncbi:MAG TPA: AAA family ATPase [Actinomycetota bacterium]|jgi:chromosome segregation protein
MGFRASNPQPAAMALLASESKVFLRSLTLRGFKSFADKTVLEFTPGISVIVGPNGSGKSNIVDSIAWVLGEQGPRTLRGGQMADVIFAGSPARPQLGMADVRLIIDNEAGLIKVPASEIEISRSIFRSGDSEYRLGGRPCRLLDIQEILSDAGLGRALHAIVGQGQLEEVLQARPEERRQFIEEAAGIAKHRRRRERAERKLAGLEQDLLRLNDVAAELRRQLRPLEKQAELAGKHEALTAEAGAIATRLAGVRLRELYRDRDRRRPSWQEAEERQAAARARLDELGSQIEELEATLSQTESQEQATEREDAGARESKSAAEARLRTAIRREAEARERLAAATGGAGRLFTLEDEVRRLESALQDTRTSVESRETELDGAEAEFRRLDQERRDAEDERRRAESERASRRAEADALRRSIALQQTEQERLARVLGEVEANLTRAGEREASLEAEIERLDATETPLAAEQSALGEERAALAQRVAELEAQEQGLAARQEVLEARRSELAESPGAAFARRHGTRPIGVLRDLITAPAGLETALLGALGAFADAVVYASSEDAVADAADEPGAGVLLAVADGGPARFSLPGERSFLDAVTVDRRVIALAGSLLAQVYLAEDLDQAAAKHREHPHAQFVTREGVVVGPAFVRTQARHDRRLEGVRREIASLERELAGVRRGLREARQRLVECGARSEQVRVELEGTDRLITAAAEELAKVRAETASMQRERELQSERLHETLGTVNAARLRLPADAADDAAAPELPPRPEPPIHLRVEVESLRRERSRLEAAASRMRTEIQELSAEDPVALRTTLAEAEAERIAAEAGLSSDEARLASAEEAHRAAADAARGARDRDAEANRAWREQAAEVDRLRLDHEEEDRARLDLERRVLEAERLLREGHGVDPGGAVAQLADDDTVEVLQRKADLVARRLEMVGRVNLLAAEELGSLRERHDFLNRELEDVKSARRDLQQVIREVDRQMAELFDEAFRDVSREFSSLFETLFPGGEGRLVMENPADVLGTGIEVEARPGRKRVKRLSLLSGGERSLTAIAFLFAIFRARPSPFYLMDEVEAALDDVNLHRFLDAVRYLSERSQVLIVTHQKRTMEMADVLYGVTMAKDGTTKVVTQRLSDEERSVNLEAFARDEDLAAAESAAEAAQAAEAGAAPAPR